MKGPAVVYVLVLIWALVSFADWIAPYHNLTEDGCRLDYVYDGDTVAIACGQDVQTARLVGFDTPEARDPGCTAEATHAAKATARLRALSRSGDVTFSGSDFDRYGRLLVTMRIDGVDVGETLIDEGLAVSYTGGTRINWCAWLAG